MDTDQGTSQTIDRVPTGLPGLDAILHGGFFRGGVYMLLARPGSGKTILGNHTCFRHVASGGQALYVTLLAESHARMISALKPLAFFDPSVVGAGLTYVSGYDAFEKGKLKGLLDLLRRTVRDYKATFLVLDGLVTVGSVGESELETKKFIHGLQVFAELVGCTTLLLTGANPDEQYALSTMVDGLLELHIDGVGMEVARTIEVTKFRGSAILAGRHLFQITDGGIDIYPRTESRRRTAFADVPPGPASFAAFGIDGLDRMLDGGVRTDSTTLVLGAPGSGKTILGLGFLAEGAKARTRGLHFGFFEPPEILCRKASAVGIPLADHMKGGLVEVMWQSPRGAIADDLAEKLLAAARRHQVQRLFIDGLDGFKDSLVYPERSRRFFSALCDELRAMGVAVVMSDQTQTLDGIEFPERGLTAMLDNVISLRHVEDGASLRKRISVVKMREGKGDSSQYEFSIGRDGFVVSPVVDRVEAPRAVGARAASSSVRPRRSSAQNVTKKRGR